MRYLLDTNVISELVVRNPSRRVTEWLDRVDEASLYLSVITIGELRKGIAKLPESSRRERLRAWLSDELLVRFERRVLALDVDAMLTWGDLMSRMDRAGTPLSAMDSLIAALALHHSCTLVTRNEEDFRAASIDVLNPWTEPP